MAFEHFFTKFNLFFCLRIKFVFYEKTSLLKKRNTFEKTEKVQLATTGCVHPWKLAHS